MAAPPLRIRAGDLIHRIDLQSSAMTNTEGSNQLVYTDVATVYAKVTTITGRKGAESFQAGRTNARDIVRVMLRYRADVDVTWRFIFGGNTYNITHCDRTEQRAGILYITGESVGAA